MTVTADAMQFTRVDDGPDTSWFVRFMDAANALPAYQEIRAVMTEALGHLAGTSVLDVGCGTGDDARELANLVGDGRVLGVDLSEGMIAEARRRSTGSALPVEFRVADLARLAVDDRTFDRVRAKLVLMHCADIDAACAELVRVLRPGGRLVAFEYDFDTSTIDHPDERTTREIVRYLTDSHGTGWCGRQLVRRFRDLGLHEPVVVPRTVIMPFSFFHMAVAGRLASAQANGSLRMSVAELDEWWRPLTDAAAAQDRFFSSLTGFVLAASKQ